MIPIDVIESTANELMAKAAIEIPDDYLTGLKKAADSEDGDLSSYVLRAMLDNYVAAKEDGRAMCGDTGTPRWYVKMGNETTIEGGPIALEAALRRATAPVCGDKRGEKLARELWKGLRSERGRHGMRLLGSRLSHVASAETNRHTCVVVSRSEKSASCRTS